MLFRRMAKPSAFGPEGIIILALAIFIDLVNIILGFLDLFLIGLILSPIWNFIATITVGVWLAIRTGQELRATKRKKKLLLKLGKRIALPFIGHSIPISKFIPYWTLSVWSSLDKGSSPEPEQEEQPAARQPQTAPTRA